MQKINKIVLNCKACVLSMAVLLMAAWMLVASEFSVYAADVTPSLGLSANLFCLSNTADATNSNLQWGTSLGSKVDHYVVYRAEGNNHFSKCYETKGLSYQEYYLEIGQKYTYKVEAVDSKGNLLATSNTASVTPCRVSSSLNTHSNMTGGDLVYATSGTKIGNTYYRYSMKTKSNEAYLVESTSKDGKNFSNERIVADKSQNSDLGYCKLESVQMKYIEQAGKMIIWAHWELPSGYDSGKALVITGTPGGKFTVHHVYNPLGIYVRDMTIFVDDDGTGYLAAAANAKGQAANATLYLFKMNRNYDDVTEVVKKLHENQYREFPNMVKRDGYYYLFTSQAAGWYPSKGGYIVTKNLYGDWSELRNIGNTSTFSSQSGWVENVGSKGNCVLHAYRWLKSSDTAGSTLCPLYFANGYAFYDYCTSFRYSTTTGELYPVQEGELLSLNKPATSSIGAKTSASKAFDGAYYTAFEGSEKKWPFYLQVDLKGVYDLSNIQVSWYLCKGSEGYYTYYVQGSTDGKNWTTILDRTNTSSERVNKTYGFTSDKLEGKARYVRLYVKNAHLHNNKNNNWYTPTVYEVKVFGREAQGANTSQSECKPFAMYDLQSANGNRIADSMGNKGDLKLYGNYKFVQAQPSEGTSRSVLRLDGSNGTYAALPNGILDGKNSYTISLLAKTESVNKDNFFTLGIGQDSSKYLLFKIAKDTVRFNITTNSWQGESGAKSTTGEEDWCRYTLVVQDKTGYLYFDNQLMGIANMNQRLSDLGSNLNCYLGKSFYSGDGYFKGQIASVEFYDYALSSEQVAKIGGTGSTHQHQCDGDWYVDGNYHYQICKNCGEKVNYKEHTYGEYKVVVEPTTDSEGLSEATCEICKKKTIQKVLPKLDEKGNITIFSGKASASDWGQAVTKASTLQGGDFDPAKLTTGGHFYIEYSGTKDQVDFILQSKSGGPDWAKVSVSESGSVGNHYYARYSYDNCVAAFGTSDFAKLLDFIQVGATGTYVEVYSLIYEPAASVDSGDSDSSGDVSEGSWDSLFWGVASASDWDQAVSVYTNKNGGSFDGNNVKPGGHFYVEYTGTKDKVELILQSWSGGSEWGKVRMTDSGEANGHYYATFSYDNCVSALGSSDFSGLLDSVHVGAAGADITVYSVCYDYGK